MKQADLTDALALVKRMGTLLGELVDLSRQLAEALDRRDQVAVEMLVAMRAESLEKLVNTDQALRHLRETLPNPEDGQRLAQLLNGGAAQDQGEAVLAERLAANRRVLEQARQLDQVLNAKLARGEAPKTQMNSRA